ncbi:hypothetical protein AB664_35525 [Brucella anthropi]|uniref:Uncharacterized protein n=1 Tax=Brucella anthropi TaxID=529 RepID=A0A656Z855_BRUAN|nr:hypothetical protein AB664_35525 [Brucella anthropi]
MYQVLAAIREVGETMDSFVLPQAVDLTGRRQRAVAALPFALLSCPYRDAQRAIRPGRHAPIKEAL